MRFVDNCRLSLSLRASAAIKPQEIVHAETHYIKLAQQEIFVENFRAINYTLGQTNWTRWLREWLPGFSARKKWNLEHKNM